MKKEKKISTEKMPLVAVDLGSGGFRAMCAEMQEDGSLKILGTEESHRFDCVERGEVIQSSNAGFMIGEIMRLLKNRIGLNQDIQTAFVSLGARGMTLIPIMAKRDLVRLRAIPNEYLEDMEQECITKVEAKNPLAAVLDMVPYFYKLDDKEQDYPPSPTQKAIMLEAHYMAFVGRKALKEQVVKSFEQSKVMKEYAFVRPDALVTALVNNTDTQEGCAIIDMGAQTTTLSVFKGTQFLETKVVSVGGHDITTSIAQQGMPLPVAEKLKCTHGWASPALVSDNHRFRIKTNALPGGQLTMMSDELAQIISERIDQAVDPLMEIINTRYADRIHVLYITGGASLLNGMEDYIQSKTSVPVQFGSHGEWLAAGTPDEMYMPQWSALVGTLLLGYEYRKTHKSELTLNSPLNIKQTIFEIFTGNEAEKK